MNINLLKAEIVKNGLTFAEVAKKIGISETTMTRRKKSGVFGLDEADRLIALLHIEEPEKIFYSKQLYKLERR